MRSERLSRIAAYTLTRWEAYLIVAIVFATVMVAIVGQWPGWIILAALGAGVLLLALLVLDSLSDPGTERDASIADVEPGRIRDKALRARLQRALEYVRATHQLARRKDLTLGGAEDELPQMEDAARAIYQLCLRLQNHRADRLVQRDLADLRQIQARRGALTQDQLKQLGSLQRLEELMSGSEREIDRALADLGRSYAEMRAIEATPELRGQEMESLRQLGESTRRLSDLAAGYDEVFSTRPRLSGS